jgi:hypothetical protein
MTSRRISESIPPHLPLPRAGEGRGEPLAAALFIVAVVFVAVVFAACGNYSNEDLEYMNAVPATDDMTAKMPTSSLMLGNEAELSRDTHAVIKAFNGALQFLDAADTIRTWPPTSRIPNGRIWGPWPMNDHPGWQMRFTMTRDPVAPEMFAYRFEVEPIGAGDAGWIRFIDGSFVATGGGARKGMGHFHMQADDLRNAAFHIGADNDSNIFKSLDVIYSTAAYPISVTMTLELYPKGDLTNLLTINYHYEQQETGQAAMEFSGTDAASGASVSVTSRWLASGRGRADATATDGTVSGTRTECWDDSFAETYNSTPWSTVPGVNHGDQATDCPDISTL